MQLAQLSTPFLYLHASLAVALGVGILLYYSCWIVYILYLHPLANYPGPKLWLISRIPYSRGLRQGTLVHRLRELHDVYGPVVRFGINELSFTNPGAWKEIYGFHGGPDKDFDRDSRFYQPAPNGIPSILSANNVHHASIRKLLAPPFLKRRSNNRKLSSVDTWRCLSPNSISIPTACLST